MKMLLTNNSRRMAGLAPYRKGNNGRGGEEKCVTQSAES